MIKIVQSTSRFVYPGWHDYPPRIEFNLTETSDNKWNLNCVKCPEYSKPLEITREFEDYSFENVIQWLTSTLVKTLEFKICIPITLYVHSENANAIQMIIDMIKLGSQGMIYKYLHEYRVPND